MLKGLKEGALSLGLKSLLNEKFADYGEILDCDVDTSANKLRLKALLKGETQALSAAVERYDLQREGGEVYIVIAQVSASRQWMSLLLNKLFAGKRYQIPAAIARLL